MLSTVAHLVSTIFAAQTLKSLPGSYCKFIHRRRGKTAIEPRVILPLFWVLEDWRNWGESLEVEPLRIEIRIATENLPNAEGSV